jgi:hypothetical protein
MPQLTVAITPGDVEHFADDIADPRGQYRRRDHQVGVIEILEKFHDQTAERGTHCHAAQRQDREACHRMSGAEGTGQRRRDREAEQYEASRVVQQALAFEQHHQPARQCDALEHGLGGDRIGRRDDRAEREACAPWQAGHDLVRDYADHQRREGDGADRQQQDAAEVAFEFGPDGEVGAVHQEGRQEHDQHECGIEHDGGQARHEGHGGTAYQQSGGRRQAQALREELQPDHRDERQQDEFEGHNGGHRAVSVVSRHAAELTFYHMGAGWLSGLGQDVLSRGPVSRAMKFWIVKLCGFDRCPSSCMVKSFW